MMEKSEKKPKKKKAVKPARMPGVADLFPSRRPPPVMVISEAQQRLADEIGEGSKCPCCRQDVRMYCRKLNTTMARGLLWLCLEATVELKWVDYTEKAPRWLLSKGGTLATLAHWELIEARTNEDEKKRASGVWRPTPNGWDFAHGKRVTPSHVFLYDNRVIAFSNTFIGIEAALGDGFDYEELMKPIRSMQGTSKRGQTSFAV